MQPVGKVIFEYAPQGDDERTCQILLVRYTNFLQAAREPALQGFYQVALAAVRDANLTAHLLAFFGRHPEEITRWRESEKKDRSGGGRFSPSSVLRALGKDDAAGEVRGKIHGTLSDNVSHPTFSGYGLLSSDPKGATVNAGAFFDPMTLQMVITATIQGAPDVFDGILDVFKLPLPYSSYPQQRTLRLRVTRNPRSSERRRAGTWPNRRAILSLLISSERSVGEIERELRLRSDGGFPSASDTLRSVLSCKNHHDWLFPRIYARRNIALKSYMTILTVLQ